MMETKVKTGEGILKSSAAGAQPGSMAAQPVIVLHDLTTTPTQETSRRGTRETELTAELGNLRNENQRLKAELRDIKLVLSKVQIDELRSFERINSWLSSIKKMI